MDDAPDQIELAPMVWIRIDREGSILSANSLARQSGFKTGTSVTLYLPDDLYHLDGVDFFESIAAQQEPATFLFELPSKAKHLLIHPVFKPEGADLWMKDISEQIALAEKLRHLKSPEHKKLRQIHHLTVTSMGYAELLDVIMEDNDALSPEKMNAVRQYHSELSENLLQIQQVINEQQVSTSAERKNVIVVDGQQELTELLTELLRTEGYKVTGFTDSDSAVKYCRLNSSSINTAVIDESMTDDQGMLLEISIKTISPDTNVILLSTNPVEGRSVQKPVDFEVLLQAVRD